MRSRAYARIIYRFFILSNVFIKLLLDKLSIASVMYIPSTNLPEDIDIHFPFLLRTPAKRYYKSILILPTVHNWPAVFKQVFRNLISLSVFDIFWHWYCRYFISVDLHHWSVEIKFTIISNCKQVKSNKLSAHLNSFKIILLCYLVIIFLRTVDCINSSAIIDNVYLIIKFVWLEYFNISKFVIISNYNLT